MSILDESIRSPSQTAAHKESIGWLKSMTQKLVQNPHRGSGTEFERQAANWVAQELESIGLEVELQEFRGPKSYATRILVHLVFAVLALGAVWISPAISIAISFVTLISILAETSGLPYGLSRLLPRAKSQNVVAVSGTADTPLKRLVVSAHIDTQQTGWIWNERLMKGYCQRIKYLPGPMRAPLFWFAVALVLQLVMAFLAGVGWDLKILGILAGMVALFHSVAIVLTAQWSKGSFVPGANDNATGVVAAMALAKRWLENAPHDNTEMVVLLTGCEEPGVIGAAAWADRDLDSVNRVPTLFVNLDVLGCRHIHYLGEEAGLCGTIFHYPPQLLKCCRTKAVDLGISPDAHSIPTQTDGIAFLARGMEGITITSSDQGMFVPHYHTMDDKLEYVDFQAVAKATEFAWQLLSEFESGNADKRRLDN